MNQHRSPATGTSRHWQHLAYALLFFAAGAFLCWQYDPLEQPFTVENQVYYYVAERVAAGVPPHVSLVDRKHALSSILSGWAIAAGRSVGIGDVLAARLLSIAAASATVACLWALALELSGSLLAAHLSALVMLTFTDFFFQGTMGARPKVFMAFFLVAALLALARKRTFQSGVYSTFAFLCWQPALIVLGAVSTAALANGWHRRSVASPAAAGEATSPWWRDITTVVVGTVAAVATYEAYFVWHGALGEQLYQTFAVASGFVNYAVPTLGDSLAFIVGLGRNRVNAESLFPLLFLAGCAASWAWLCTRPRRAWSLLTERPAWLAVALAAYAALAFTFADHQAYPDMFILLPFIALASGLMIERAINIVFELPPQTIRRVLALLAGFGILVMIFDNRAFFRTRGLTLAHQYELAVAVAQLRDRHGPVWAIGCPHLLALDRTENHSPFGVFLDANVRAYLEEQMEGREYRPLKDGKPPAVILISRGGTRSVIPWLRKDYRQLKDERFEKQGIHIWIRSGRGRDG